MTLAEALDLLELSPTEAADIQRIRDAYARRRNQLQSQLDAAAAAPVRAAYQETLAAVDMAAAMLQTRAKPAGDAPNKARRAPPSPPQTRSAGASASASSNAPEWITATPWSNIRNEAGEYRPDEQPPAQAAQPPAQVRPPAPRAKPPPPKTPASAVTMRLPDAVLGETPKPAEELRPVATTLGRARPETPKAVSLESTLDDGGGHSRWGTVVALLLAVGGLAGVAGWAWQAGVFDQFFQPEQAEISRRSPGSEQTAGANLGGQPDNGADEGTVAGAATIETEMQRQLAARRSEVERLGHELDRLAAELGGKTTIDWQQQLAAASAAEEAGEIEEAAERLAQVYDGLRSQSDAAARAAGTRQRLRNAGALDDTQTPIASAASQHLQSLVRQAELSVADGNYAAAAQKYDLAMGARLRLPRDIESIEPARARAAVQLQRATQQIEQLELDEQLAAKLLEEPLTAEAIAGRGRLVEAWLTDERGAADLVREFEQIEASLEGVADRLQQIAELQALAQASEQELARLAAALEPNLQSGELMTLLDAGGESVEMREAEAALRAGRLDEAVESYKSAAAEASERLESAVRVSDLLDRRAAAQERLATAVPEIRQELEALEQQLRARMGAGAQEDASPWAAAASRLAEERAALLDFAAQASGDVPGQAAALEEHVRDAELRASGARSLSAALAALVRAEYRLLLLTQLAAGTNIDIPPEAQASLERAGEAREAFRELLGREGLSEAQIGAAAQEMTDAAARVGGAADALAAPAAAKLAEILASKQQSYEAEFGAIDLKHIWEPAEPPADFTPTAALAAPVAEALSAEVEAEDLQQHLAGGSLIEAEAVLRHVRALEEAEASLTTLRQLAEQEAEEGARPLHTSASANNIEQVRALLALGVSAAPRDSAGHTPLGRALAAGYIDVASLLLESGGKPQAWLEGGRPIIFIAPASPEALRLLLRHGAPARDLHRGETALHALAWQANREKTPPAQQLEAARLLIEAGVDREARNRSNQTAAELAASLGLGELAEFLRKT